MFDEYASKRSKHLFYDSDANNSLSWSNLFAKGSEADHREIIYLKPKLNTDSFFPSKDSLNFLKSIDLEFYNYRHANRINIYLDSLLTL